MTDPREDFEDIEDHLAPDERDPEAPSADAVEQSIPANPADQSPSVSRDPEVGEWDALEQSRTVDLDDDYR